MQQPGDKTNSQPLLLEIGSEEIPARFIPGAMKALAEKFTAVMTARLLSPEGVKVMAAPRRLVLLVDRLPVRQPDRDLTIKGPPVKVAFGPDGSPTPAGVGFARKAGVALEDCGRREDQRGEFLVAHRKEIGRPALDVLGEVLPELIMDLPFRKVMRWADYDLEYPRPLQWLVALLGDEVVPFQLGYLRAGRISRGHRTLAGNREVVLERPGVYLEAMSRAGVIPDPDRRRELILTGFQELLAAFSDQAELVMDQDLLNEVVFLCEHPTPFLGTYDEEFFALPAQVITTALKAHQRYFTVQDRQSGRLFPRFAAVRDGGTAYLENVIAGNERVLRARLSDALFYWRFDQQKSPDQRTELLGKVTWVEGFGTVLDKSRRLVELCDRLWTGHLGLSAAAPEDLLRAAYICKNDLTSEMIKDGKEFTKLEGFIGARYAELAGESPQVASAIEEHYLPRAAAAELPSGDVACCLAVADRLDTVCGCWLAGFAPTGAKDPYALRRHVLAVIRILLDRKWHVDLREVLATVLAQLAVFIPEKDPTTEAELIGDFIRTRLEGFFIDGQGYPLEVVRAVLPVRWQDPVAALAWIRALEAHRDREDFLQAAAGFKRCRNILKGDLLPVDGLDACLDRWLAGGSGATGEDFAQLGQEAALALKEHVAAAAATAHQAELDGRLADVFAVFSDLGPAIDRFFTEVRVNVEDEHLRTVRMAFLREIHGLFARYGDFQEMVGHE